MQNEHTKQRHIEIAGKPRTKPKVEQIVEGKGDEQGQGLMKKTEDANWESKRRARRAWWPAGQRERKLREGASVSHPNWAH